MDIEASLRKLRTSSIVVTVFAILLLVAGIAQLGLGGMAVKEEMERIDRLEELSRPNTYYGYAAQRAAVQREYNRSGSRFFLEGRFLSGTEDLEWTDPAPLAFIGFLLAALGLFAASLAWIWQAHSNLEQAGVRMKYTAKRALAAYIIPVANLIFPLEAMRELHNRSHGEPEDFAHSSVENVTAWWTSLLVGLLVLSLIILKFVLDAGTNIILMTPLWMEYAIIAFAILLLLGGAWLFASLTREISRAQMHFLPEIAATAPEEEPVARPRVNLVSGQN